jgi:hypothetical protein
LGGAGTAPSNAQCIESRRLRLRHLGVLRLKNSGASRIRSDGPPSRTRGWFNAHSRSPSGATPRTEATPERGFSGRRTAERPSMPPHPVLTSSVHTYARSVGVVMVEVGGKGFEVRVGRIFILPSSSGQSGNRVQLRLASHCRWGQMREQG